MSDRLFDPAVPSGDDGAGDDTGGRRRARSLADAMPLAARMRPRTLDEYVGQSEALGEQSPLRRMLAQGQVTSLVLWGPPGAGKTSLANVIAATADAAWEELSAVTAGVKDVRAAIDRARTRRQTTHRDTIVFIDEIHRFNKGQQDALLPAVEDGSIVLVGATTENPFFELNAPLMSRCRLIRLEALTDDDVRTILRRAIVDPDRGYGGRVVVDDDAEDHLVAVADGDARSALNALEIAVRAAGDERPTLGLDDVAAAMQRFRYDKASDAHYDQVSAFIKSMRGSDPDAAVYWLLRMLRSGEDPRFLARRMVIFASEDVGLADRQALPIAVAAFQALDRVGLPEAKHNLVHAVIALATAPKSNAVARALSAGERAVDDAGNAPVPPHLRDAHYGGAARIGHGAGYQYPHDHPGGYVVQQYLPDTLRGRRLYEPTDHGHEDAVRRHLQGLATRTEGGAGHERESTRSSPRGDRRQERTDRASPSQDQRDEGNAT